MYNPRGAFPGQRPPRMNMPGMNMPGMSPARMNMPGMSPAVMNMHGMSSAGMMNQGPYMGAGEMNLQGMSQRIGLQGIPNRMMGPQGNLQRFGGTESFLRMGQQMHPQDLEMNMPIAQHRIDPRSLKEKMNFQEMMPKMRAKTPSRWEPQASTSMSNLGGHVEMTKQISTPQVVEHTPEIQSRYTTESASSILASFGLSNEDLEELSRYPDDQLTPENMPLILRDIRLRKMGNQISSTDDAKNRGRISGPTQSNVIDYGHGNKYGYNEDPVERHIYSPVTNLETRNDYQAVQTQSAISMETQQSNLSCNQGTYPIEEIMRQIGFQNETSNLQPFFQVDSGRKIPTVYQTPVGNRKIMSGSQTTTPASRPIQVLTPATKPKRIQNQPTMGNQPRLPMASTPSLPMASTPSLPMASTPSLPMASTPSVPMATVMNQQSYQAIPESAMQPVAVQPSMTQSPSMTTKFMKGNWVPVLSQADAQKMKRLPTPSMMNDYYAASPRIFPHLCSLCNVECRHLKDWIQHQNTNTHIESCRQLRQQYPDWNPQVLATLRNEGDKKDDQIPKKRSGSSGSSPRRFRRSSSRHRAQRSRSRSPPKFGRIRSRSRSPRRIPRRSPVKSRSPRRRSRSPALSPRRARRLSRSPKHQRPANAAPPSKRFCKSPEKKDFQTAAHSSTSKVVSSSNKQVSSQAKTGKATTSVKKTVVKASASKLPESASRAKKPTVIVKKPGAASTATAKKPGAASATAAKKPVNPSTTKTPVSNIPSKSSGQAATKEVYNPLQRFKSKLNPGTIIHISDLPDGGYTDQDIIKIVQPFGKVSDVLIIRSKNEAYLETNYKEAAVAAVKFSETVPVLINRKRVKLRIAKQQKSAEQERNPKEDEQKKMKERTTTRMDKTGSSATPPGKINGNKMESKTTNSEKTVPTVKPDFSQPKGSGNQTEKTVEPVKKKKVKPTVEEIANSVVLVTNLPDKGYTVEEISNLAKPFGGVKDLLVISSHKKAYLQMANETSADSLVKFYACFPMSVAGNQLSVKPAPKYKNVNDVETIFTDIIAETDSKKQPDIHEQFVHIRNLPAEQYTEFQLVCMGLRFGKVDNYVVLKNKRKAILQLDSPKAAKTMVSFLKQYPVYMSDHMLKCTLSPNRKLLPGENLTDDETDEESAHVVKSQEAQNVDGKMGASSTERKEETGVISNIRADDLSGKTGFSKPESEKGSTGRAAGELPTVKQKDSVSKGVIQDKSEVIQKESEETNEKVTKSEKEPSQTVPQTEDSIIKVLPAAVAPDSVSAPGKLEGKLRISKSEVLDRSQNQDSGLTEANKLQAQDISNPGKQPSKVVKEPKSLMDKKIDNPQKGLPKSEAHVETKTGESISEKKSENSVPEHQKEELAQGKSETVSTVADETKKIVASGDKASTTLQKNETSAKSGEQKSSSKSDTRKRSVPEKKPIFRDYGTPRPTSRRSSPTESSGNKSKQNICSISKRNSGRGSSKQEKDLRGDSRSTPKSQERENRSGIKKDDMNKASAGKNTKSHRSEKSKELDEDDELFPFDLDEFVTVDEVVEETQEEKAEETTKIVSPYTRKNLPKKGKRKEPAKDNPLLEPSSKKSRVKETTLEIAKQELSFVTLDEIGDEEDGAAAEAEDASIQTVTDIKPLETKDKILTEEDISTVKDSRSLFTLDEISDEEDVTFQSTAKDSCVSVEEEPEELDKGQPLVTLDEVGEEEEHTLTAESSNLKSEEVLKVKLEEATNTVAPEGRILSQPVENPGSIITVHKALEDTNDQPLVTLDEVNEDEEESMADLNFVTVDEVGEEEEEDEDIKVSEETTPEEKPEDQSKIVRKAGVTNEMGRKSSNKEQQAEIHGRARRAEHERS